MNPLNPTPGHASHDSVLHRVNHYREIKDRLTSEEIAQPLVVSLKLVIALEP
jgi:hypothetical protein